MLFFYLFLSYCVSDVLGSPGEILCTLPVKLLYLQFAWSLDADCPDTGMTVGKAILGR